MVPGIASINASTSKALAGVAIGAGFQMIGAVAQDQKAPQFEKGGLIAVGGNRHSAGGTLFTGSDGTTFEAERGEIIGVMSRPASAAFMAFNNAHTSGVSGSGNYFQNGGVVQRAPGASVEAMTRALSETLSNYQPIVLVDDIANGLSTKITVEQGANF